jgi:hypothetical protein
MPLSIPFTLPEGPLCGPSLFAFDKKTGRSSDRPARKSFGATSTTSTNANRHAIITADPPSLFAFARYKFAHCRQGCSETGLACAWACGMDQARRQLGCFHLLLRAGRCNRSTCNDLLRGRAPPYHQTLRAQMGETSRLTLSATAIYGHLWGADPTRASL